MRFSSLLLKLCTTLNCSFKSFNDLLLASDSGHFAVLMIFDRSAAFHSVDHNILISHLEYCVGIRGVSPKWFRSYLSDISFSVDLDNFEYSAYCSNFGVPQGSILGPISISLYICPLGSIIRKHGVQSRCYVDDTQLFLSKKPPKMQLCNPSWTVMDCLRDIKSWIAFKWEQHRDHTL